MKWSAVQSCRQVCRRSLIFALLLSGIYAAAPASADDSIARTWNEQLISAIGNEIARPPVQSRNAFHVSAAMYDAWAAYDPTALGVFHNEKIDTTGIDVEAARNQAISYAVYDLMRYRYIDGPGATGPRKDVIEIDIVTQMLSLGYDPLDNTTTGNSPAALGHRIAQSIIDAGLADGSNEVNDYADYTGYTPVNDPYDHTQTGNVVLNDVNRWQPLHFEGGQTDKFGQPIPGNDQEAMTPHWAQVQPFALKPSDKSASGVYLDQGAPPSFGTQEFKDAVVQLIDYSSRLDPAAGQTVDVSPAEVGNHTLGSYVSNGYSENPHTGQPYDPHLVNEGDWTRAVAEFWADPPSQWNGIANYAIDQMDALGVDKRVGGTGPVVDDLEYAVKTYLTLNASLNDAGIAAWDHKISYDYLRPITMIRYMAELGQSSNPGGPSYDPDGLPLVQDLIEVITADTTVSGQKFEHLAGHEGEIAILAYTGPQDPGPFTTSDVGGVEWILAADFMPFQISSFVTPNFPGYVSGHSTFARAAAEALAAITGDPFFPGGLGEWLIQQGSLLAEYGPTSDIVLQWATYFDASDESGLARLFGGIHVRADDLEGRDIGHLVGLNTWELADLYFQGVPEPASLTLLAIGAGLMARRRTR